MDLRLSCSISLEMSQPPYISEGSEPHKPSVLLNRSPTLLFLVEQEGTVPRFPLQGHVTPGSHRRVRNEKLLRARNPLDAPSRTDKILGIPGKMPSPKQEEHFSCGHELPAFHIDRRGMTSSFKLPSPQMRLHAPSTEYSWHRGKMPKRNKRQNHLAPQASADCTTAGCRRGMLPERQDMSTLTMSSTFISISLELMLSSAFPLTITPPKHQPGMVQCLLSITSEGFRGDHLSRQVQGLRTEAGSFPPALLQ